MRTREKTWSTTLIDNEVKVEIKPFNQNGEWLYFCCDADTYRNYGQNALNQSEIIGISSHVDDAVLDFLAQYTLINGVEVNISLNDFYQKMH